MRTTISSVEVRVTVRAREVTGVGRTTLMLHHVLLDNHRTEVGSVDVFRSQDESLLAGLFQMEELDTVILWHDVVLDKFELRVAPQRLEAEFKVEQFLDTPFQVSLPDALWLKLKQSQHSFDHLL